MNKLNQRLRVRGLKAYTKIVKKINNIEKEYTALSDEALKAKTAEFKELLKNGKSIDDLSVDAFATVREASKRVLGLRHYDVQLIGGLVLLNGNVGEMVTGEGKTLVGSLSSYLIALEGKGAHIITVNDYLASRDREIIGPIFEFLGLTVGLNVPELSNSEKQAAYNCDITYGVGTEFGFDYLRDNMVNSKSDKVQRPFHYAIIDEIDSILIDEARTPLIVAGKGAPSEGLYYVCADFVKGLEIDDDYLFDPEMKSVSFTEDGITKCEDIFGIDNLFALEHSSLFHALLQGLRANVLYERDVDYIVKKGKIELIDMNTGRLMEGRSLSDGLHQAIEAKESLENTEENITYASITIQNYFRMYPLLSGMTGTAKTEETEFLKVYNMDVVQIPTNKPRLLKLLPDKVYLTMDAKYEALVTEVRERHATGQPILIGTTSILQSEKVADLLEKAKISYQLLNAKSVEQEANLIALAGQKGQITIATNMAGRGTDIMLGEDVAALGGLHVLGSERNESRRIDDQLKGRSARQGDPGSAQFIVSLEDQLIVRFAADELERVLAKFKSDETSLVKSTAAHKMIDTAQKISEGVYFQYREFNLKLENVMNEQRDVIYKLRDAILETDDIIGFVARQTRHIPVQYIQDFANENIGNEEMDIASLKAQLATVLLPKIDITEENLDSTDAIRKLIEPFIEAHSEQVATFKGQEGIEMSIQNICLSIIDHEWKKHLDTMAQLKEGIGIRQYQQEDPVTLFEKEGYQIFQMMYNSIEEELSISLTGFFRDILQQANDFALIEEQSMTEI